MGSEEGVKAEPAIPPRRWLTPEFLLYYAVIGLLGFANVIPRALELSNEYAAAAAAGKESLPGLERGWIAGRFLDQSDHQWHNFRSGLPMLAAVMASLVTFSHAVRTLWPQQPGIIIGYWLAASLLFISYLHGACVFFILAIAIGNYYLCQATKQWRLSPVVIWLCNCIVLLLNRTYSGYQFAAISPHLAFLDGHRGAMRWHIYFNVVMLRMVSYGVDLHYATTGRQSTVDWDKHRTRCLPCAQQRYCYHWRQEHSVEDYTLGSYLCFLFYAPLYIAGPHASYNAFLSQLRRPQQVVKSKRIVLYALRFIACTLVMEVLGHFTYFNAMAKAHVWRGSDFGAFEIGMLGYGMIHMAWLKFLLIWRFFRLFALLDGVDTPENMPRCISNNYDIEGFWRNWHCSYNRWLVRQVWLVYLYIPLGGAKYRLLNVWVIFTFVALWHDIEWNLLCWAWLTCLFIAPEMAVKYIGRHARLKHLRNTWKWRHICAVAATVNIFFLLTSGFVGFLVGVDGVQELLSKMFCKQGVAFLVAAFVCIFCATHIMFEARQEQRRAQVRLLPNR
eukprot:jgi/Chlat1/6540/Chrsp45S06016